MARPNADTNPSSESDLITPIRAGDYSSSTTPYLEIVDAEPTGSFRSIFDRVKNTLSPSLKRRTSENVNNHESSGSADLSKRADTNSRKTSRQNHPNVLSGENREHSEDSEKEYSTDEQKEIIRYAYRLAEQILHDTLNQMTSQTSIDDNQHRLNGNQFSENETFQRGFHRTIQSQRISGEKIDDEIYQDLSTDIVSYVLKHALKTVKNEEELYSSEMSTNVERTHEEDFIDLK